MTALIEKPLLPDFIHGEAPDLPEDGFRIDDERKAAWACSKILAARRRIQRRAQLCEAYQTRILDWLTKANESDEHSVAFLESALRPWTEEAVSGLRRTRSILLPGARLGLRKRPDRVEVTDTGLVTSFCQEHQLDGVIVTKIDLSKSELKRHLSSGAQIPGAVLVPGDDELSVSED